MITLDYFMLPLVLLAIGIFGIVFNKNHIISIAISVEIMFLSINLAFALASVYLDDLIGQVVVLFLLGVAASETAIMLAIIILLYRTNGTIALQRFRNLKY